jgi:hypothetical protein
MYWKLAPNGAGRLDSGCSLEVVGVKVRVGMDWKLGPSGAGRLDSGCSLEVVGSATFKVLKLGATGRTACKSNVCCWMEVVTAGIAVGTDWISGSTSGLESPLYNDSGKLGGSWMGDVTAAPAGFGVDNARGRDEPDGSCWMGATAAFGVNNGRDKLGCCCWIGAVSGFRIGTESTDWTLGASELGNGWRLSDCGGACVVGKRGSSSPACDVEVDMASPSSLVCCIDRPLPGPSSTGVGSRFNARRLRSSGAKYTLA